MWKVDPPEQGDIDAQLAAALIQKNGAVDYALSAAELAAIKILYDAYDGLLGEPNAALKPALLDACKDAILNAYSQVQKGGRLAQMRGELLAGVIECPFCGVNAATTLDHHLPKDDYRALAIYPRNLVPGCQPCNRAKGTLEPVAGQGMIHAYFQDFPQSTFLVADVEYHAGKLVVTYSIDDTFLIAGLGNRLTFQLDRLKLNERYFDPINIFLFSLKPALNMFRGKPDADELLKRFLTEAATTYDGDFGLNHWKAALMRGLSVCDSFIAAPWAYFERAIPLAPAVVVA